VILVQVDGNVAVAKVAVEKKKMSGIGAVLREIW
jgi:hypothetical protein